MVYREAARYPRQIAFAAAALVTTAAATLAIPWRFKVIVDDAFSGGAGAEQIAHAFEYLLMIVFVLGIGTALRFYFVSWLGERVVANIRLKVQENLLRQSPSFYEENSPKEISSRMTSDTAIIETVVGTTVSVALRNALTAIGGILFLLYLAPSLTLGLLIGIPLVLTPIVFFGRKIRTVSRSNQDRVADVGAYVTEVLGAMPIVQSFGQEKRESKRFAAVVERTFDSAKRRILLRAAMTSIVIVLIFVRPGAGEPASSPAPTDTSAPVATDAATADPSADPSEIAACDPSTVRLTAITDASSYGNSEQPMLSMEIENVGAATCSFDVGTGAQEYVITSGSEQIWSSADCQEDPTESVIALEPSQTLATTPFAWDRTRSSTDTCSASRPEVIAGGASYHLTVKLGEAESAETKQFLLN